MDNLSRHHPNEDATTTMYLSFDAESTNSTACYRTLEAMSDISGDDMDVSVDHNKTGDNDINSTLEEYDNTKNISPLKTVKKIEIPEYLPLRALQKNILNEYTAVCSTPSKEQLLKSVDINRGSDSTRCIDLGLAFLGVDDEKPAYFSSPAVGLHDENKENVLPEPEEISSLSTCSSTTVIEKKMITSTSTVCSITEEEESLEKEKNMQTVEKDETLDNIVNKSNKFYCPSLYVVNNVIQNDNNVKESNKTPKDKFERFKCEDINKETLETKEEKAHLEKETLETREDETSLAKEMQVTEKHQNKQLSAKKNIAVFTRNTRRSICEPNLQANKPSRILNSNSTRRSLLPTCTKSAVSVDAEIPLLMKKMLKITNNTVENKEDDLVKEKEIVKISNNPLPVYNRRSFMPSMKTRSSLIPSAPGNKRPLGFTNRMSVLVKTTLNSPARKIARKSSISGFGAIPSQRKSIISQKVTSTDSSNIRKPESVLAPKIMVKNMSGTDINVQQNSKILDPLQETSTKYTSTLRKSVYSSVIMSEKGSINISDGVSHNKTDNSYTCNVCKEKFRIKSLLDAHKRSHEKDNLAPAFIKKPLTINQPSSGSVLGNSNQCKYCDKKFALLRALNIHLLQNCLKIPPSEKRKLKYTDLNHVEKAQLPNVFSHQNLQSSASSSSSSTPRYTLKQNSNLMTISKSSKESLNENGEIRKTTSNLETKIKRTTAHAGIYKTPNKTIPCHLCKLRFKSILDYTNHNLTIHSSRKAGDNTGKTIVEKYISHNA